MNYNIKNKKWDENQEVINQQLLEIRDLARKYDSTVGVLGARWGINSEQSFRNGLVAILEGSFDVKVQNIIEFDEEGYVFGRPDQVELDIIIKNGLLIIIEIKSSMRRSDIYIFNRKIEFYEKSHNRKVTRRMVISPMVTKNAWNMAKELDIEVYSYSEDIEEL